MGLIAGGRAKYFQSFFVFFEPGEKVTNEVKYFEMFSPGQEEEINLVKPRNNETISRGQK